MDSLPGLKNRKAVFLTVLLALAGCTTTRPSAGKGNQGAIASAAGTISDPQLRQSLEREGEKLHDAGGTVPMATLREQLARRSCRLQLPIAPTRNLSAPEVAARMQASVAIVGSLYKCTRCTHWHVLPASGFFLTADGAVVTCHHVVDQKDHTTLLVMDSRGRVLPVREILAADPKSDLAILRVDGSGFRPLALAPDAPVGSAAHVMSHPDHQFYCFTSGVVSRQFLPPPGGMEVPMLAITADFGKGSSGAPVCNDRGALIGVVNNTRSLYYTVEDGKKDNLQMVFKHCTPADSLRMLVRTAP